MKGASTVQGWKIEPTYEELTEALESMNCGLLVRDEAGRIRYANRRLLEWTGFAISDLEDQTAEMLVPEEARHMMASRLQDILAGDQRATVGALRRKDGRTFPAVALPAVLEGAGNESPAVMIVLIDLGDVQTAKATFGSVPPNSLAGSLHRISRELEAISLYAPHETGSSVAWDDPLLSAVSAREREVLAELLTGARVPAIAERLFISPHTVRNHLKSMYRKLGVTSQSELIERVRGLGGNGD